MRQLKMAWGKWGTGSFDYDAIGNITQMALGNRTVDMTYDSFDRR